MFQGTYLDTILPRADLPENQAAMPEIGQRVRLSKGDILQTMALYQCPTCGRTYQDTAAKFGSPQHSALYSQSNGGGDTEMAAFKKGDKCEWRILATHGEKIILNITSLDIPESPNCQHDYLEVRKLKHFSISATHLGCRKLFVSVQSLKLCEVIMFLTF